MKKIMKILLVVAVVICVFIPETIWAATEETELEEILIEEIDNLAEEVQEESTEWMALDQETESKDEQKTTSGKWIKKDGFIRYKNADGSYANNGFQEIDGNWYYFEKTGYAATDWKKVGKYWYYFNKTGGTGTKGKMLTGWIEDNGKLYYLKKTGGEGKKGRMLTGLTTISKKYYYFNSDGALQTGWHFIDDYWYYFKKTGSIGTKGKMITGWLSTGGKIYYLKKTGEKGEKGRMLTGVCKISNQYYYLKSDGAMQTGWHNLDNQWYYFKKTGEKGVKGRRLTGVNKIGDNYFYFKTDGKLLTGWREIDGKWYYFKKTGGTGTKGKMLTGWSTISEDTFYFDKNGVLQTGWQTIDGKEYYFLETGDKGVKGRLDTTSLEETGTTGYKNKYLTDEQMTVLINAIGAVETGGQVYGKQRYDDFTSPYKNSSAEHSSTAGAFQEFGENLRQLLLRIKKEYPKVFKKYDTAGIAEDISGSAWSASNPYQVYEGSKKAKAIVAIISSKEGIIIQDKRIAELIDGYLKYVVEDLKVTNTQSAMFMAQCVHLGGKSPVKRIVNRATNKNSMDSLYKSLLKDQEDTSNSNQIGDAKFQRRHEKVRTWLKEKVSSKDVVNTVK